MTPITATAYKRLSDVLSQWLKQENLDPSVISNDNVKVVVNINIGIAIKHGNIFLGLENFQAPAEHVVRGGGTTPELWAEAVERIDDFRTATQVSIILQALNITPTK